MSRTNQTLAHIYNPLNQDKQSLLDNFVIRHKEFEKIFKRIKESRLNEVSQNFLIQGQRGSGKTTLLARLKYEIEDAEDLNHLIPIQFTEEQYNIYSLNRLWENVADILEDTEEFENLSLEIEDYEDDDEDIYFILEKYLKKNQKKLVLLIDNFGDILDKISEKEHKKLRDILHESDLQIIAGSTRTLESTYRHDKPFFESFKTIYLESLKTDEVMRLLGNIGRRHNHQGTLDIIKKQKGRIETIRRLTGGVPRTIILLYEIILDDSANVFEDLEGLLDKITPLYKHKMDDLPAQQQVIVDAIALNWDGMLAADISKKTRLETKKISAQLKLLEKNGMIISKPADKKNKLYMIEERFFNIWYLMRYGRKKNKQRVVWLVNFLKDWCTAEELIQKAQNHINMARQGRLHLRGGIYMAEALSDIIEDAEVKYEVLTATKKFYREKHPEFSCQLSNPDESVIMQLANQAYHRKDYKKAEGYCLKAIENKDVNAMFNIAFLYETEYRDYEKAEKYYLMASENNNVIAMNNLALLYETKFKDYEKAEKYYLMASKNNDTNAMFNLALLYDTKYKNYKKAEKYYLMASENNGTNAMFNLALLYDTKYKNYKKAEKYYLMASENKDVKAMHNLGFLYQTEYKDYENAEKYYLMAVKNNHPGSMNNLAFLYQSKFKDHKKAEKYYLMAIDNNHLKAMKNLAALFQDEFKDFEKAKKYYLMAIENNDAEAMFNLGLLYQKEYKDDMKAKPYYFMAIDTDLKNDMEFLIHTTPIDNELISFLESRKAYLLEKKPAGLLVLAIAYIQDGEYEKGIENFRLFLDTIEHPTDVQQHIANFLILLMARKQYHLTLKLFQDEKYALKETVKPVYYALMYLMQDEFPKEIKKMGEELKETVDEILRKIQSLETRIENLQ